MNECCEKTQRETLEAAARVMCAKCQNPRKYKPPYFTDFFDGGRWNHLDNERVVRCDATAIRSLNADSIAKLLKKDVYA